MDKCADHKTGNAIGPNQSARKRNGQIRPGVADGNAESRSLDPAGIGAFSASFGMDADWGTAVVCSMLTGIAGQRAMLATEWGSGRLPKLDLILSAGQPAVSRMVDALAGPIERINRHLVQKSGLSHPSAVGALLMGALQDGRASHRRIRARRLEATLRGTPELQEIPPGWSDFEGDPAAQRREALVNPSILLKNAAGPDLAAMIQDCHCRHALLIQPALELDREGSEPDQIIRSLLPLLDGILTRGCVSGASARGCGEPARAQMILCLRSGEADIFVASRHRAIERFLWIGGSGSQGMAIPDSAASGEFFATYERALQEIVGRRCEGGDVQVEFQTPEGRSKFYAQIAAYESNCASSLHSKPGISVMGLPQSLFWGLSFLGLSRPDAASSSEADLVDFVFECARRLAMRHDKAVLASRDASRLADGLNVARRVVDELTEKDQPLKLRSFARCFNRQGKERIQPVLDAMVGCGILDEKEKSYRLAAADLDQVEDAFLAMLAEGLAAAP
jgi:hypothetical protein